MAKNSANTLDQGKAPAFQFYAADFDTATRGWLPEEVGVYIRLLCNQWTTGPLPSEPRRLAAIVGMPPQDFEQVWRSTVGSKFVESKDGFYNERLEKVREDQRAFRKRQSEKGRKGAAARWRGDSRGNSTGNGREHGRNMALHTPVSILHTPDSNFHTPDAPGPLPEEKLSREEEEEIGGAA